MSDQYTELALDHFQNPRNVGALDAPDAVGEATNPVTGAVLEIHLRIHLGCVTETRFSAQGCTATIAAGSILTELLVGRAIDDLSVSPEEVEKALGGLPPTRRHAARLAADAATSAVAGLGKAASSG